MMTNFFDLKSQKTYFLFLYIYYMSVKIVHESIFSNFSNMSV